MNIFINKIQYNKHFFHQKHTNENDNNNDTNNDTNNSNNNDEYDDDYMRKGMLL